MNNCTLIGTECYKYLGVILDSKMSWVQHITYVKSKVSEGIGIMYQARKYLDKNSLINLYNNFILFIVWNPGGIYQSATSTHCLSYKRKYLE